MTFKGSYIYELKGNFDPYPHCSAIQHIYLKKTWYTNTLYA